MTATCPACGRKIDKSHEQRKLFHALCRDIGLPVARGEYHGLWI